MVLLCLFYVHHYGRIGDTLKPIHLKVLMDIYDLLRSENGKLSSNAATGKLQITEILENARIQGSVPSLDPFTEQ